MVLQLGQVRSTKVLGVARLGGWLEELALAVPAARVSGVLLSANSLFHLGAPRRETRAGLTRKVPSHSCLCMAFVALVLSVSKAFVMKGFLSSGTAGQQRTVAILPTKPISPNRLSVVVAALNHSILSVVAVCLRTCVTVLLNKAILWAIVGSLLPPGVLLGKCL